MRTTLTPILFLITVLAAAPVHAQLWSDLDLSAMARFDKQDWNMLYAAGRDALDNAENGDSRSWKNPETGASGTITPLNREVRDGRSCRQTRFVNAAANRSGETVLLMCRIEDGTWKVAN